MAAILTISVIAVIPTVAENSSDWITLADWDGEQDVEGSAPTSFAIDKGTLGSVAVRPITYYLKDDSATNPLFPSSTKGVVIYNQTPNVCNPTDKTTPATMNLGTALPPIAKICAYVCILRHRRIPSSSTSAL